MSTRETTLSGLRERELLVLLHGITALVGDLEGDDSSLDERYDWDDIARMRERIQAARRRVGALPRRGAA